MSSSATRAGIAATPRYGDDHDDFRASWRAFLERHVRPHLHEWEAAGAVPREVFRRAGEAGFLGLQAPEEHGGAGVADFRFNAVIAEEAHRIGAGSLAVGMTLHNDVVLPYLLEYADEEQRRRWLPGVVSGEQILA